MREALALALLLVGMGVEKSSEGVDISCRWSVRLEWSFWRGNGVLFGWCYVVLLGLIGE